MRLRIRNTFSPKLPFIIIIIIIIREEERRSMLKASKLPSLSICRKINKQINKGEKNDDKKSVNFLSDSPIFYVDRIFGYWKNCSNRVRIDHLILITSLVSGIFCVSVAPFAIIIFETFCFHYFCDPWMCFEY